MIDLFSGGYHSKSRMISRMEPSILWRVMVITLSVMPYRLCAGAPVPDIEPDMVARGRMSGPQAAEFVNFLSQSRQRSRLNTDKTDVGPVLVRVGGDERVTSDERSAILKEAASVSCSKAYLSVAIKKATLDLVAENVLMEQLSFRDTEDVSCRGIYRASNATHYGLVTLPSLCHTSSTYKQKDGKKVQVVENQVLFRPTAWKSDVVNWTNGVIPSIMIINVTCSIYLGNNIPDNDPSAPSSSSRASATNVQETKPILALPQISVAANLPPPLLRFEKNQEYSTTNQSFRMTLSDKAWTGPDAENTWVKHPYPVIVGNWLYAQIQLVQPSNDEDLKAHAKECFFSKNSDPISEPKSKILVSGCPVLKSQVTLQHTRNLPVVRYTRMIFLLERIYFDSNYMYFQCKVVSCSLRGGREQEGYETCPNSSACSERTVDQKYVPVESPYAYVSSGLMRPIIKSDLPENGKGTCPPCPTVETVSSPAESQQSPDMVMVSGVTVPVVICIGVASFVIGLLMMGGLWYVHEHTEPKKYLNVKRRNSDRDSSSFLSAPLPNACTPMTKNGHLKNGEAMSLGAPIIS